MGFVNVVTLLGKGFLDYNAGNVFILLLRDVSPSYNLYTTNIMLICDPSAQVSSINLIRAIVRDVGTYGRQLHAVLSELSMLAHTKYSEADDGPNQILTSSPTV